MIESNIALYGLEGFEFNFNSPDQMITYQVIFYLPGNL